MEVAEEEDIEKENEIVENGNKQDGLRNSLSEDKQLWRDLFSFWLLGFCNYFGIFVILTAALETIEHFTDFFEGTGRTSIMVNNKRPCRLISVGVLLLADSIPELIVKSILPFIPLWITKRISVKIFTSMFGFILAGVLDSPFYMLLGVVLVSASAGLGETTLLQYCAKYNNNVLGAWSSGTGAAGLIGVCTYRGIKIIITDYKPGLLVMICIPIAECLIFFKILRPPSVENVESNQSQKRLPRRRKSVHFYDEGSLITFKSKMKYSLTLYSYAIPLTVIVLAQNLINAELYELVYFDNTLLGHSQQYRWLHICFHIGSFIAKSSVQIYQVTNTWVLVILQCINLLYFLFEIIYYITPSIWFLFLLTLWEGFIGGAIYVSTFYKILKSVPPTRQEFAIGFVSIAIPLSIVTAGMIAIPIHNTICKYRKPNR